MLYLLDKDFFKKCLKYAQRTKRRHGETQEKSI